MEWLFANPEAAAAAEASTAQQPGPGDDDQLAAMVADALSAGGKRLGMLEEVGAACWLCFVPGVKHDKFCPAVRPWHLFACLSSSSRRLIDARGGCVSHGVGLFTVWPAGVPSLVRIGARYAGCTVTAAWPAVDVGYLSGMWEAC